ncbi:hypothetical protein PybrP1_008412, partial [[Pythium] brassicae (nom. inval.)]
MDSPPPPPSPPPLPLVEPRASAAASDSEEEVDVDDAGLTSTDASLMLDAAARGDASVVRSLLSAGGDGVASLVQAADSDGRTVLAYAVGSGSVECVAALLQSGAEVDAADRRGRTPLMVAASFEVAAQLISSGAQTTATDRRGQTPLHHTVKAKRLEVADVLLRNGASDVNAKDCRFSAVSVCKPDYFSEDIWGDELSVRVRDEGKFLRGVKIIKLLLRNGADVNDKDKNGRTALSLAAHVARPDLIRTLLRNGASVNLTDDGGLSPLYHALELNQIEAFAQLIMHS